MSSYPVLEPPAFVDMRARADWSYQASRRYFEWLLNVAPKRLAVLQSHFRQQFTGQPLIDLGSFEAYASEAFWQPEFSSVLDRRAALTAEGNSLATDMGFLLAESLIATAGISLRWAVAFSGPRSYVSKNLPVVVGFGGTELDPVLVSTNVALGIVRRRPNASWVRVYRSWLSKVDPGEQEGAV